MNTNNTKQSKTPNSNKSQSIQGCTWNWRVTISERVLLALVALVSTYIAGFTIGNSQGAILPSQELSPQSAISSPMK
jgi:hypothetical protein